MKERRQTGQSWVEDNLVSVLASSLHDFKEDIFFLFFIFYLGEGLGPYPVLLTVYSKLMIDWLFSRNGGAYGTGH